MTQVTKLARGYASNAIISMILAKGDPKNGIAPGTAFEDILIHGAVLSARSSR